MKETSVTKTRKYPVTAPLEYHTRGAARNGMIAVGETGAGRTLAMSSSGVLFEADRPLRAGLDVTLSIAWPATLSESVGLTLRVSGRIVYAERKIAVLTMKHHEFYTRRLAAMPQQHYTMTSAAA